MKLGQYKFLMEFLFAFFFFFVKKVQLEVKFCWFRLSCISHCLINIIEYWQYFIIGRLQDYDIWAYSNNGNSRHLCLQMRRINDQKVKNKRKKKTNLPNQICVELQFGMRACIVFFGPQTFLRWVRSRL